jgi:hypothetical protein
MPHHAVADNDHTMLGHGCVPMMNTDTVH